MKDSGDSTRRPRNTRAVGDGELVVYVKENQKSYQADLPQRHQVYPKLMDALKKGRGVSYDGEWLKPRSSEAPILIAIDGRWLLQAGSMSRAPQVLVLVVVLWFTSDPPQREHK